MHFLNHLAPVVEALLAWGRATALFFVIESGIGVRRALSSATSIGEVQ